MTRKISHKKKFHIKKNLGRGNEAADVSVNMMVACQILRSHAEAPSAGLGETELLLGCELGGGVVLFIGLGGMVEDDGVAVSMLLDCRQRETKGIHMVGLQWFGVFLHKWMVLCMAAEDSLSSCG